MGHRKAGRLMRLLAPEWLIFLPLLVFAAWHWPRLRLRSALRLTALVLLALVLAHPELRRLGKGLDLWVLVDRSVSAADALDPRSAEWETLLQRSMGRHDRLYYVDYADVALVRGEGDGAVFPGTRQATRTRQALEYALARMAADRASRLLVWTDGYSTEPLAGTAERLVQQQVPLDYRLVGDAAALDYQVAALELPQRVQRGEPLLIEARITGLPDATVPYELLRDGQPFQSGTVTLQRGVGWVRVADRLTQPGSYAYACRIKPAEDARPGNNQAEAWIEIVGGPRVVLVSSYQDDPLAAVLRTQGFDVESITEPAAAGVGRLTGAKLVVLNNAPAHRFDRGFLQALDFFVREQGGGLLMAGGKYSFGAGGYFQSPVDELLPVSMELRQEHRKLAVALAIVLDRSGSMTAGVGAGGLTKMDLANEGAARAVELLGANDAVTVLAVDSAAHVVVPLTVRGSNPQALTMPIRGITSAGGGIFVYTGLQAGWEQLKKTNLGQRHLILFADAADAEEPGDYEALLATMVAAGARVSVIGLGTEHDSDAAFLTDVATRGQGRVFFNENPADLPALFAQETVAVARSAFIEEPVGFGPTPGWLELAARPLTWLEAVDGYNLSYLRDGATAAAFSTDEYAAPLVAFWQRGVGRVAAVSFPLGGEFSERVRGWAQYGDFVQTVSRWLMGEAQPPGIGLQTRVRGLELTLDLLYDEAREETLTRTPPRVLLAQGTTDQITEAVWQRIQPGQFQCIVPLEPGRWVRGVVQVGSTTFPFGPVMAGGNPEWSFDRERLRELQNISRLSGGEERLDLTKVWTAPARREYRDLRPAVLWVFLGCFLLEALQSRLGWRLPQLARAARRATRSAAAPAATPSPPAPAGPGSAPRPPVAERRRRFQRAKHRGL